MSDFILKFWPEKETNSNQTSELKKELIESQIIGEETDFWGKPAYKAGKMLNNFLEPKLERNNPYFETIAITIEEKNYGVIEGTEDFEYIDRMNVISIKGGEGAFNKWNEMCEKLEQITGKKYQGGWELL
jgi:hypothetical protein